ncbi:hypothetical protein HPB52_012558 [Rhipicephalus sanguineus]|uniref:DDE Tnp4 domain-containing protein n=1 Tax=Rhipicephalus sanguineus TaxID=34632 RepID=A0A9D4PW61_RHISA|nr:hypothetical protein HPB52_012558 [Rhipicephalus sanguineus]
MDNGMFRTCFRFEKEDVPKLRVALRIPETVMTAQRVPIPGDEALCITLRRLAYPNRLKDLENFFGRHKVLRHIDEKFFHLLDDVNNHSWLTIDTLENFSKAYTKLEKLVQGHHYCLYGDPAYPLRPLLLKPYGGASLTPEQCAFNKAMSSFIKHLFHTLNKVQVFLLATCHLMFVLSFGKRQLALLQS